MTRAIQVHVTHNTDAAATCAAQIIADAARAAIAERDKFLLALSGGSTPLPMFRALAAMPLAWSRVEIFQVDERLATRGSGQRNLSQIEAVFGKLGGRIHAMAVEDEDCLAATQAYESVLRRAAGEPPVLDLIHLGLGEDGHTASLLPGDATVAIAHCDVGISGTYQGTRRMTMTLPLINRARMRLWLVCGPGKRKMIRRALDGDRSIPAGLISGLATHLVTDQTDIAANESTAP